MGEALEVNPKLIEDKENEEAQVQMWDYIFGFTKMAVVKCAIQLGIADAVENHHEPMTLSELSSSLKCSPPLLNRIMRFLSVLHDWNDEECIQILKNCIEAIPKDKGKVIIVEAVIDAEENDRLEHVRFMFDMVMMAHTNTGKERTFKEWEYLIHQAGFTRYDFIPIREVQSVIVAFP